MEDEILFEEKQYIGYNKWAIIWRTVLALFCFILDTRVLACSCPCLLVAHMQSVAELINKLALVAGALFFSFFFLQHTAHHFPSILPG